MNRSFVGAIAVAVAVGFSTAPGAQGPRRDGRWDVMVEMSMPGMPGNMPPLKTEQCVTPDQAENPESLLPPQGPAGGKSDSDCKITDQDISGSKVTFSMSCTTPQEMTGTGEFLYGDDTFEGVMTMTMQGQTMSMKYKGTRLGDCVQ
jgi:hypothetical protein